MPGRSSRRRRHAVWSFQPRVRSSRTRSQRRRRAVVMDGATSAELRGAHGSGPARGGLCRGRGRRGGGLPRASPGRRRHLRRPACARAAWARRRANTMLIGLEHRDAGLGAAGHRAVRVHDRVHVSDDEVHVGRGSRSKSILRWVDHARMAPRFTSRFCTWWASQPRRGRSSRSWHRGAAELTEAPAADHARCRARGPCCPRSFAASQ